MKTEKIIAIIFVLAVILKFQHMPGSGVLLVTSLSILAMMYFPAGLYFLSDNPKKISMVKSDETLDGHLTSAIPEKGKTQNMAWSVVAGFLLSIVPIAIMFKLQYWPGSQVLLLVSVFTAPIIAAVSYYLMNKGDSSLRRYYKNMVLRAGVLSFCAILLFMTPASTMLSIQYGDDPEMVRVKTQYYSDPQNEEYRAEHDAYMEKKRSGQ